MPMVPILSSNEISSISDATLPKISGTVEILDEIEADVDDVTDSIMGDFESEFLSDKKDENTSN